MCRSFPGNADSLASMALATVGFLLFLQLCIVVFPRRSLRVHRVLIQSRPSLCPSAVSGSHQLKLERLVYKTLTDGPVWMWDIAVGFRFRCEECNGFGPLGFLKKWPLVVFQSSFCSLENQRQSNIWDEILPFPLPHVQRELPLLRWNTSPPYAPCSEGAPFINSAMLRTAATCRLLQFHQGFTLITNSTAEGARLLVDLRLHKSAFNGKMLLP